MSIDLELATVAQIAEELKKRQDTFVLISCKEPKTPKGEVLEVGLMTYGHPRVLVTLLQQASAIIGDAPHE